MIAFIAIFKEEVNLRDKHKHNHSKTECYHYQTG
jgi:hypothetical protein